MYVSQDPIGLLGGIKIYAYVPNPLTWTDSLGLNGCHVPDGPMKGKRVGHTFDKHGSHNTHQLQMQAKNSGLAQGQWVDDAAAEKLIADNLDKLKQGTATIEIPLGVGRVVNPDGTFSPATHAVLVPSGSGVKTAFPIIE
jgi:uncharacterized protein RhaS with RHS repeats